MVSSLHRGFALCALLAIVTLDARPSGGGGGELLPPIGRTRDPSFNGASSAAGGVIIPPSSPPLTADDHQPPRSHVRYRVRTSILTPGRRTIVLLGPDALEPGAIAVDVTLPADAAPQTIVFAYPLRPANTR